MRKVAFRYTKISGHPVETSWRDIEELTPENIRDGDVIEYAYAAPVVTDEMVTQMITRYKELEPSDDVAEVDDPVTRRFCFDLLTAALEPDKR